MTVTVTVPDLAYETIDASNLCKAVYSLRTEIHGTKGKRVEIEV